MARPKKGNNLGGRPRKEIDIDLLTGLVEIQATAEECASVLGISVDTLDRRVKEEGYAGFAEFYKKHSDTGKVSLRRAQWKAAQDGNVTMLIWLGKQMLGQKDKQDFSSEDGSMTPKSGGCPIPQAVLNGMSVEARKELLRAWGDNPDEPLKLADEE